MNLHETRRNAAQAAFLDYWEPESVLFAGEWKECPAGDWRRDLIISAKDVPERFARFFVRFSEEEPDKAWDTWSNFGIDEADKVALLAEQRRQDYKEIPAGIVMDIRQVLLRLKRLCPSAIRIIEQDMDVGEGVVDNILKNLP